MGNIAAVILAAGASRRMGRFKPLLKLGGRTLIERVIGTHRSAGVEDVRVMVGHDAAEITPVLDGLGVNWIVNPHPKEGMFSSVQIGVADISGQGRAFFVQPVDVPLVSPQTLVRLAAALEGEVRVVSPCFHGRRGHPPLLSASLIPAVAQFSKPGGLRVMLAEYEKQTRLVECDDAGILIDLDRPEDYRRVQTMIADKTGRRNAKI